MFHLQQMENMMPCKRYWYAPPHSKINKKSIPSVPALIFRWSIILTENAYFKVTVFLTSLLS